MSLAVRSSLVYRWHPRFCFAKQRFLHVCHFIGGYWVIFPFVVGLFMLFVRKISINKTCFNDIPASRPNSDIILR